MDNISVQLLGNQPSVFSYSPIIVTIIAVILLIVTIWVNNKINYFKFVERHPIIAALSEATLIVIFSYVVATAINPGG